MKAVLTAATGALLLMAGAVGAQAAAPAQAERPLGVEASIPFADSVGIRSFRPDGDSALWIQGQDRQWYRAELMGKCWGLDTAIKVGFVTKGVGSLDKFSQIVVDGAKCQISSLTTSAPPPSKAKPAKPS
mgnify:FL=1